MAERAALSCAISLPRSTRSAPGPADYHYPAGVDMQKRASALTRRQLDVLTLSARGRNAAQIAKELRVTSRTVNEHRRWIFRKLSVSNITHAVAVALTSGMIDFP